MKGIVNENSGAHKASPISVRALLATPLGTPAVVVRIGADGAVERVIEIPIASDAWRIALWPAAHQLLLASGATSAVFRVRLPEELWNH